MPRFPGEATGLDLPIDPQALQSAGADFLTAAFHAFGSLALDNAITRISRFEPFEGGNSGQKLLLSVEYTRPETGLRGDLFVKMSRDLADSFRDRRRHELEAEVRIAALSRVPAFPVAVPAPLFADCHPASGTGLLITERIAFGTNGIEPLRPKGKDHLLPDALDHYQAIVAALARLAGAQKSGRLSPEVDRLFPFSAQAAAADMPITWPAARAGELVRSYADFAEQCPRLVPAHLRSRDFIARLERDVPRFRQHEASLRTFLHADPDLIALCHWNANIDNAWFWRDAMGGLHCGLLDWGMTRQMNIGFSLWSALSMATAELWDRHLDALLATYVETLHSNGGPTLDPEGLKLHLDLSVALLGLALMMDAPAMILARQPQAAGARDIHDPILAGDTVATGFLHAFTLFLNLWERHGFGDRLDEMLGRMDLQPK